MSLFSRTKIDDQPHPVSTDTTSSRRGPVDEAAAQLQVLGLAPGASADEIVAAHARLVSDLTPGPDASHRNVALAEQFLREVNQAFDSLRRMQSVA